MKHESKVLIIGYGNRLRSDDGFGPRVAEELAHANSARPAETIVCHQLTPELAERISQVETVLFIDAARTGPPGEICCRQLKPQPAGSLFAHRLTPETLLSLCNELYAARPQAFEISLRGDCFELGDGLSEDVAAAVPDAVDFTRTLVKSF